MIPCMWDLQRNIILIMADYSLSHYLLHISIIKEYSQTISRADHQNARYCTEITFLLMIIFVNFASYNRCKAFD